MCTSTPSSSVVAGQTGYTGQGSRLPEDRWLASGADTGQGETQTCTRLQPGRAIDRRDKPKSKHNTKPMRPETWDI